MSKIGEKQTKKRKRKKRRSNNKVYPFGEYIEFVATKHVFNLKCILKTVIKIVGSSW